MLGIIRESLDKLVKSQRTKCSASHRIQYFKSNYDAKEFVRKDYLQMFKDISIATATRDLKKGVEEKLWKKMGDNRTTKYKLL